MADDDRELARRVAGGDREALGVLFERHRDFVYRVALGLTADRALAEDVVQNAFLALWRHAPRLDFRASKLTTWLYRVARNAALDAARSARRAVEGVPDALAPGGPEFEFECAERRARLARALHTMPARPREVFVLRIGLGLSVERTAELIGCSEGAVRTALHTAGRLLKLEFAEPSPRTRGHLDACVPEPLD